MDKLLQQYAEKFGENFPIMYLRHMNEAVLKELIKKSIKDNKPYEAEYDAEGDY